MSVFLTWQFTKTTQSEKEFAQSVDVENFSETDNEIDKTDQTPSTGEDLEILETEEESIESEAELKDVGMLKISKVQAQTWGDYGYGDHLGPSTRPLTRIDLTITNTTDQTQTYEGKNFKLETEDGRTLQQEVEVEVEGDGTYFYIISLDPGEEKTTKLFFSTDQPSKLHYDIAGTGFANGDDYNMNDYIDEESYIKDVNYWDLEII